jgi:hypothetical protein
MGSPDRVAHRSSAGQADGPKLVVSWCDARFGRYGYQVWRKVVARKAGICVATGRQIKAGETVYKPRKVKQRTLNADAMICTGIWDTEPIGP